MKAAFLQCPTGVSGNMFLGALADAGLEWDQFVNLLTANLPLAGYRLKKEVVVKNGITATLVTVEIKEDGQHRHLSDIEQLISGSNLPTAVKEKSIKVFRHLARAEAAVHNCSPEQVHFHEVGAVDAIIDIVGSVLGLHLLEIEQLYASPLPLGTGFINCDHGTLPVPAPATLKLLEGYPIAPDPPDCNGELTTPTGAALVTTLAECKQTPMKIIATGFGAGNRDLPVPNAVRLLVGEVTGDTSATLETISIIETNIDDMNPEFYDYLMKLLFANGALDVFFTPVHMKNNRPGILLTVVAKPEGKDALMAILRRETTSLGFRYREEQRLALARDTITVTTGYGSVKVKVATSHDKILNVAPEYKDCAQLAEKHKIPIKVLYDEAKLEAYSKLQNTGALSNTFKKCP